MSAHLHPVGCFVRCTHARKDTHSSWAYKTFAVKEHCAESDGALSYRLIPIFNDDHQPSDPDVALYEDELSRLMGRIF